MDRRDFLLLRRLRQGGLRPVATQGGPQRTRHYVLSCEWLYNRCLDRSVSEHGDLERAIFDEESIRMVFDDLDDRLRKMDTVRVTKLEWLVGDLRKEFGTLMRGFKSRGGRVVVDDEPME